MISSSSYIIKSVDSINLYQIFNLNKIYVTKMFLKRFKCYW